MSDMKIIALIAVGIVTFDAVIFSDASIVLILCLGIAAALISGVL